MSTSSAPPEGHISAAGKGSGFTSLVGIALAFLPPIFALIYLGTGLSSSEEDSLFKAQANNALEQRTTLIESEVAAITNGLEKALAEGLNARTPESIVHLIPGGTELQLIPLSDMGVASLDPADYGLTSLVLLDSVRKTFETGNTGLEVVTQGEAHKLVAVARFTRPNIQGVAIVSLNESIIDRWVSKSPVGKFALWQTFADSPSIQINPSDSDNISNLSATTSRAVKGTPYVLGLSVDASKVPKAPALPFLFWPLILASLGASYWVLFVQRRGDLESDVKSILETADSRETVILKHAELSPLAFTLRQLASNNRSRMRRSEATNVESRASQTPVGLEVETELAEITATTPVASDWSIWNGSWIGITDAEGEAEELEALKKMALGIAGLTARSSVRSFVVSSLGGEAEARAKTSFIKALLSEGVDVIDIGLVPQPVAHMATHNGTSSGAALIIQRDENETLTVGAVYNRQWAEESFWQKVTALSNEPIATSSNGRSIKLELIDDYCDRLSADMAMAEELRVNVLCDNPVTLAIAEKSLEKTSCEVRAIRLDPGFTTQEAQSLVTDHEASLSFIFNSQASRLTVLNEHANRMRDDHIFMLLSQDALARHPGSDVIVGNKSSRSLPSFITSCGGASKMVNAMPHSLQREMADTGAIIGGDCDGAFYLRDRWFGSDDAIYAAARLTEIVSNEGALTDLIASLPETSLRVLPLGDNGPLHAALWALLAEEANFAGARVSRENGIRVDFADSWVHIDDAALTNKPTLRIEGDDDDCLARLEGLITDLLLRSYPELKMSFPSLT